MEASIESSNAEVCCSEKEFVNSKKTRSAAAEESCTVCKQQTSEGVDLLRISSTTLAYPLQKKHHPLLQGNLEVLFLNPLFHITEKRKSFQIVSCLV